MSDIKEIIEKIVEFSDQRDWGKFHNPKDLAIAIDIEASELLELFLWKSHEQADIERIREELADIFSFSFLLAIRCDLDVKQIIFDKIRINELKYPVSQSKGNAKKYTEL